jgi:hypothetical protein
MAEWNNPDSKGGLVWYTVGSKNNTDTGAGEYRWGYRRRQSFSLWLHTIVFQAEILRLS